ncbi:MAG: phosphoglucosamine mutase [Candidatus Omnitrophota bacterium]
MIQGISGARGRVGVDFVPEVCLKLASAFGSVITEGRIVVGRDTRPSGVMAFHCVAAGLLSTGHPVVDLGVIPTPAIEFAVPEISAAGAVIITASHNPAEWNGLKFLDRDGLFLSPEVINKVYRYASLERPETLSMHIAQQMEQRDVLSGYLEGLMRLVDGSVIKKKGLRVVVDCVNGATAFAAPALLSRLGAEVIPLNCEPSGIFSHPPEPRPENLTDLSEKVKDTQADLGLAFDPDGDRLAVVSEAGTPLSEELTLALCVDWILSRQAGPVVINLATSMVIEDLGKKYKVPVYRTPVGEFYVADRMKETGAVIGGEGNGGVIYPPGHLGRDGLVGAALIMEYLATRGKKISELVADLPDYVLVKDKIAQPPYSAGEMVQRIKGAFPESGFDQRDGIRIAGKNWWVLVRFSNTEPIIRIFAEAPERQEAEEKISFMKKVLSPG